MTSIETTQVDAYVQNICSDPTLSAYARGQQASMAIGVHVAQEEGLLIGTKLPLADEGLYDDALDRVQDKFDDGMCMIEDSGTSAIQWISIAHFQHRSRGMGIAFFDIGRQAKEIADMLEAGNIPALLPIDEETS